MKSKPNKRYPGRPDYIGPKSGYFLLPFHNTLVTWMPDIFKRLTTIDCYKPLNEISWRRHCIVYVRPSELPPEVVKTGAAYKKAKAAHYKEGEGIDEYWEAYKKAREAHKKALKDHVKTLLQLLDKYVPNHIWDEEKEELVFK